VQAAREAKALEAAKNDLEKQVKELTSCLEEEKTMRVISLFTVNENAEACNSVSSCLVLLIWFFYSLSPTC